MNETPKVIGIVASPRHGGNTDLLIDAVLAGARAAGAASEKTHLGDVDLQFCLGCERCQTTGTCVIEDGLDQVFGAMASSTAWVLGTPVYVHAPTAQCKAFIDRWYGASSEPFVGKRAGLIIPFADSNAQAGESSRAFLEGVLRWKRADHISALLAPGVWSPGAVQTREDLLERAREMGQQLVDGS